MSTKIAKNIKRKRIYVDDKGVTVPEWEKGNSRRGYEVVGESCEDAILEKASKADKRKTEADIAIPQEQKIENQIQEKKKTTKEKVDDMMGELEDEVLAELKKDLSKDEDFKKKMKEKLLKKLFK
jgi:hypothetical protein